MLVNGIARDVPMLHCGAGGHSRHFNTRRVFRCDTADKPQVDSLAAGNVDAMAPAASSSSVPDVASEHGGSIGRFRSSQSQVDMRPKGKQPYSRPGKLQYYIQ
jgi:hypothetical protein